MSMSLVEQDAVGTQVTSGSVAYDWRRDQYLTMVDSEGNLAFSQEQADQLASSTETTTTGGKSKNERKLTWNTPLHWAKVKKALDAGCSPAQALDIFVN